MTLRNKRQYLKPHKLYWYENGLRCGRPGDPKNVFSSDGIERGREIYDPSTDNWYWLDSINGGEAAADKTVYIPYVYQGETPGSTQGKWVRYDSSGRMMKGWVITAPRFSESDETKYVYYQYDNTTGAEVSKISGSDKTFDNWKSENNPSDWTWIIIDPDYSDDIPLYYMSKTDGPKQ